VRQRPSLHRLKKKEKLDVTSTEDSRVHYLKKEETIKIYTRCVDIIITIGKREDLNQESKVMHFISDNLCTVHTLNNDNVIMAEIV
jgi:hypothetical protein